MKNQKVRYNGGNKSYYNCSDPKNLKIGIEYEVTLVRDLGWQTNYSLKGIEGEYNSTWFDEVFPEENIFLAISHKQPIAEKKYLCYKIELGSKNPTLIPYELDYVKEFRYVGNNIYEIKSENEKVLCIVG